MYGFFLNVPEFSSGDLTGRLTYGAEVLLRGMATVFAVLAIIWFFLVLVRVFIYDLPKKKAARAVEKTQEITPAPVAAPPAPVMADAELVAAITAAIAAYTADDSGLSFRVVSFRRVN